MDIMSDSSQWLTIILLALILGIDGFAAAFAFGMKGVKVSIWDMLVICIMSVIIFGLGLLFGNSLYHIVPQRIAEIAGVVLMSLVLLLLVYGIVGKPKKRKAGGGRKKRGVFSRTYAILRDPMLSSSGSGRSKEIRFVGAVLLGVALSADALGVGIGYAMSSPVHPISILFVGIAKLFLFGAGYIVGSEIHKSNSRHGDKLHIISILIILGVIIWRIIDIL